jgi:hypothetical protein
LPLSVFAGCRGDLLERLRDSAQRQNALADRARERADPPRSNPRTRDEHLATISEVRERQDALAERLADRLATRQGFVGRKNALAERLAERLAPREGFPGGKSALAERLAERLLTRQGFVGRKTALAELRDERVARLFESRATLPGIVETLRGRGERKNALAGRQNALAGTSGARAEPSREEFACRFTELRCSRAPVARRTPWRSRRVHLAEQSPPSPARLAPEGRGELSCGTDAHDENQAR